MNTDLPLILNNNHAIGVTCLVTAQERWLSIQVQSQKIIMLTDSHLLFIYRLKYFLESNNKTLYRIPYRSTQHKTGRVQAPTFTRTATASSHNQHYDVIWMC